MRKIITISKTKFRSGNGQPLYAKPATGFFPSETVVGRMIHTPYTGDLEFVFPTAKAAADYAAAHPQTQKRVETSIRPNGKKRRVSWKAGLRYDAEIARFGGQSPYWEDEGTAFPDDYDVVRKNIEEESYAGIIARLLKK